MIDLTAGEQGALALIAETKDSGGGFKAVCEKLGVDAEAADAVIQRICIHPADDAAVAMHALLIGILAGRTGERQRIREAGRSAIEDWKKRGYTRDANALQDFLDTLEDMLARIFTRQHAVDANVVSAVGQLWSDLEESNDQANSLH